MAEPEASFGSGMPVAVADIDRQLKMLWEEGGEVATRASLMNLAVYCEGEVAMESNTALIAAITRDHACRAILIAAKPGAAGTRVRSWISAHCHISRAGAKQVCCEQISFLLEGDTRGMIPNIVFAHLDSDLPLYLWWQPEFPDPIDSQLLTWVDRLIFDSRMWRDFRSQLAVLRDAVEQARSRVTLRDLNWARSLRFREALARVFDDPGCLAMIGSIRKLRIHHAPDSRSTALLFAGWITAQLGWQVSPGGALSNGETSVALELTEGAGPPLSSVEVEVPEVTWCIRHEKSSSFLHARTIRRGAAPEEFLLPPPPETDIGLLGEELRRGMPHAIYLKALSAIEPLL